MKTRLSLRLILASAALLGAALACSIPTANQSSTSNTPANPVETAAEATLQSLRTAVAQKPEATESQSGGGQVKASPTAQQATVAPSATSNEDTANTPSPSATQKPTVQPTTACDLAGFISDVTVPDGATMPAGQSFTKTWRLRNNGTCTWTTGYSVVFDSGQAMEGPASTNLPNSVAPGSTIDISISLKAPVTNGSYRGNWKLRNASGLLFGTGTNNLPFYVDIKVATVTPIANGYDFAAKLCDAEWTGGNTTLTCPTKDGNNEGFVLLQANPILETGYQDNEPAILSNPTYTNGGVIQGKFPEYKVSSGEHFKTIVGCEHNASNCSVKFELAVQNEDGSVSTLATWNETYDNNFTKVDFDLSGLAGKTVRFILKVTANDNGSGDRAQWLRPRIFKP